MVFTVSYDPLLNIKLVKAVEKHPILYNTSSHYPFRKAIDEAWEKVGEEVNDTSAHCKERWLNLRNSYKRYLRQKRSNVVKKPYYLAEHMKFLERFIVLGGPRTNKRVGGNVSSAEASLTPQSPDKDDDDDNDMSIDCLDQSSSSGAGGLVSHENCSTSSKPVTKTCNTKVQTLVSYGLRQVYTPEEHLDTSPDLAFYMSILPDVRTMTEEQKQRFRKEVAEASKSILNGGGPSHV